MSNQQHLQQQWGQLSVTAQEAIKRRLLESNSPTMQFEKHDILHRCCVTELGKQLGSYKRSARETRNGGCYA